MDNILNNWLQTYEPINEIAMTEEIHSERLSENVKNLALQRTGFETLPMRYISDRGWFRQYQYMLLLKSESEIDTQRLTNLDWLDDFSNWFMERNNTKDFPVLEDNMKIVSVECANALTYEESEDGTISVYSLQIYFNIRKEV
ncbi:MAG: hypothetical protein UHK60_10925 [Acutalibacteraceae bacterium]|nr:hypothetical protein [Acutalibacteraceae bacterium]